MKFFKDAITLTASMFAIVIGIFIMLWPLWVALAAFSYLLS